MPRKDSDSEKDQCTSVKNCKGSYVYKNYKNRTSQTEDFPLISLYFPRCPLHHEYGTFMEVEPPPAPTTEKYGDPTLCVSSVTGAHTHRQTGGPRPLDVRPTTDGRPSLHPR